MLLAICAMPVSLTLQASLYHHCREQPLFQPHIACFDETALFSSGGGGLEGLGSQLKLKHE